ncbi:hypothetical protein IAQ61_005410 [Plenodomus lingam]|uniref:uncharacterized protein n=1 Tax=Leptosphaeria maculans TaxID=5022 RepID=UPI003317FC7A|nr:hypothetical protein IAQ61_005410 [Plenodomus lingam]
MAGSLSSRGADATKSTGELSQLWEIISNPWHPETNPTGYVSLGVAENMLMHNELRDFINSKSLVDPHGKALTYGDGPSGSKPLLNALSAFLTRHLKPVTPIEPDHLVVTNGVTTTLEHTAWALTNPGEGILLGRPYYRGFLPDLQLRTGAKVVPVSFGTTDPCGPDCVPHYEAALLASNRAGVPIRALLLCHPHNPLGRCYTRPTLIALMALCQKYAIHLVSDEIYALSTWENPTPPSPTMDAEPAPTSPPFESILSIPPTDIIAPHLLHTLWGLSKDFGANGVRLATLISQANPAFLAACRAPALFSSPSSLAENAALALLGDAVFVDGYIAENRRRLGAAYADAVGLLERHGIEYMPGANAGFFLWVRLGGKGGGKDGAHGAERELQARLLAKRVFLVPGESVGAEEGGWFRMVFSQPRELVEEGLRRVRECVG